MPSLSLLVALCLAAPPTSPDTSAAFERLKQLEGGWKTDPKAGPVQYVALRLVADGTAVLETNTAADRTTIASVTLYAVEGGELIATHHGPGGASRLKLIAADAGSLKFEGGKEARVTGLTLLIKDNKLRQEWHGREARKPLDLLREYVDTLK